MDEKQQRDRHTVVTQLRKDYETMDADLTALLDEHRDWVFKILEGHGETMADHVTKLHDEICSRAGSESAQRQEVTEVLRRGFWGRLWWLLTGR